MTHALPSSPNWYCSNIISSTDDGLVVYGARGDINILRLATGFSCEFALNKHLNLKQSSHSGNQVEEKSGDNPLLQECYTSAESRENPLMDCLLIATLSRVHKERITVVLIQSKDSKSIEAKANLDSTHDIDSFMIISGAEDGKIKCLRITFTKNEAQTVNSKVLCEYQMPKNVSLDLHFFDKITG